MVISLVGYMGCGKTTIGRKIARRLGYGFVDLDYKIEEEYKHSIRDIFEKYTEDSFRKIEHTVLRQVLQKDNIVVAMGGGTACFYNNMEYINETTTSVYIKMSAEALSSRLVKSKNPRPLITGKTHDDLLKFVSKQLYEREAYYKKAHFTINGLSIDIAKLIDLVNPKS